MESEVGDGDDMKNIWKIKRFSIFGTGLSCSFLLSHFALILPEIRVLLICLYLGGIVGAIALYLFSESQGNFDTTEIIFGAVALLIGIFYALGLGQAWIALRLLLWCLLLAVTVSTWIFFSLPQHQEES